jgi:hypothetical protein
MNDGATLICIADSTVANGQLAVVICSISSKKDLTFQGLVARESYGKRNTRKSDPYELKPKK